MRLELDGDLANALAAVAWLSLVAKECDPWRPQRAGLRDAKNELVFDEELKRERDVAVVAEVEGVLRPDDAV